MKTRTFHAGSRALSLLLALVLVVGMIPASVLPVSAAGESEYGVTKGSVTVNNTVYPLELYVTPGKVETTVDVPEITFEIAVYFDGVLQPSDCHLQYAVNSSNTDVIQGSEFIENTTTSLAVKGEGTATLEFKLNRIFGMTNQNGPVWGTETIVLDPIVVPVTVSAAGGETSEPSSEPATEPGEPTHSIRELSIEKAPLYVGETAGVTATAGASPAGSYEYTYTYSVQNGTGEAVISGNQLTAVKAGTVTVTAAVETIDGEPVAEPVSKSVEVNIISPSVQIEGAKELFLLTGAVKQLTAVTAPAGKTITWTSGDPQVAGVDASGNLKALAAGETTVTAAITVGTKTYTDTIAVKVVDELPHNYVLKITGSSFVRAGKNLTLEALLTEDGSPVEDYSIVWSVEDSNLASIDQNGVLTAGDTAGSVVVTATAMVNGKEVIKKQAVIEITVPDYSLTIVGNGMVAEGTTLNLTTLLKDHTETIKADSIFWEVSDANLASIDENGVLTALAQGTVTVKAVATVDGETVEATMDVQITPDTGIELSLKSEKTGENEITIIKWNYQDCMKDKIIPVVTQNGNVLGESEYAISYSWPGNDWDYNGVSLNRGSGEISTGQYAQYAGTIPVTATLTAVKGETLEHPISQVINVTVDPYYVTTGKFNKYDIYVRPCDSIDNIWQALTKGQDLLIDLVYNTGEEMHYVFTGQNNLHEQRKEGYLLGNPDIPLEGNYNREGIYVLNIRDVTQAGQVTFEEQIWVHIGNFTGEGVVMEEQPDENGKYRFELETDALNNDHNYVLVAKTKDGNFALKQAETLGEVETLPVELLENGTIVELARQEVPRTVWLFDGLQYKVPAEDFTYLSASNFRSYLGVLDGDAPIIEMIDYIWFYAVDEEKGEYNVILEMNGDHTTPKAYLAFDEEAKVWTISDEPYPVFLYNRMPNIKDRSLGFEVNPEKIWMQVGGEKLAVPTVTVDGLPITKENYKVEWYLRDGDDKEIVTFDQNGNITGLKPGTVVIEAWLVEANGSQVFDMVNNRHYLVDTVEVTVVDFTIEALPEATVVADFGKPMGIEILSKAAGLYDGYTASIAGFAAYNNDADLDSFADPETMASSMGSFTAANGKVVFTPSGIMTDLEQVFVGVRFTSTSDDTDTFCLYIPLTVIPANIVYYETDKVVETTGNWETVGTPNGSFQDSGLVENDRYGYDSSYESDRAYSGGSSLFAAGARGNNPTATFTFTGTGFDIISLTNPDQGMIAVDVYRGETQVKGILLLNKGISQLYQIPVISEDLGEWGEYTVKISVLPGRPSPASLANKGEFYFDAIRIYGTMAGGQHQEIADSAYRTDGEGSASFHEIRDTLLSVSEFISGMGGIATGSVYVDAGEGENTSLVSDYSTVGPKNEVYLKKDQGVAFLVCSESLPGSFDIGAKSADGAPVNLTAYVIPYGNTADAEATLDRTVATGTAMFYDLLEGKAVSDYFTQAEVEEKSGWYAYVVVTNKGENILSLTDIKLGFGGSASQAVAFYADETAASLASDLIVMDQPDDNGELVLEADGNYAYYVDGKVCTAYTGLIVYRSMLVYVEKGMVNFEKTGVVAYKRQKYFVQDGFGTVYTGLAEAGGKLLYMENGVYNPEFTGLARLMDAWYYVENGVVNPGFSGVYEGWTVENGLVDPANQ